MLDFQDSRYILNIEGFGLPAHTPIPTPTPTPTVGAVYDCTIYGLDLGGLGASVSDLIWAVIDRPYILNIEGFGRPAGT